MPSPLMLGKSRIEALSDGVFSISMTLLVLKLEVPEVMHHASNERMLEQLVALAPGFATYVVTFLIAGGFWFLHHTSFHFIRHANAALLWISLIFLMLVALLPFSAGLMAHFLVHPVSQLFYFGNQLSIAAVLSVYWIYSKRAGLVDCAERRWISRMTLRIHCVTAAFAACFGIAFVLPEWSWTPLPVFLIGAMVFEAVQSRRDERREKQVVR
jgi:uncharacterized membrane protein